MTEELQLKPRRSVSGTQRPPLRYHGSKWRIAPWVISHFPKHEIYVEPFGGAAGVLLRKTRSTIEIWNDLDDQVFNFFQVLRNPTQAKALARGIYLTPFSRKEFDMAYENVQDPVEAARRFATRCYFGHGTCSIDREDSNGFRSRDLHAGKSYAREWCGIPPAIAAAAERLRGVTIEHLDYRKLIPKYDHPDALFYCDPPYVMSTRSAGGKGYVHEMDDHDHRQMAWLLNGIKGKALVSSYDCRLYAELYKHWTRSEKKTTANGQAGAVQRTEVLWTNF